MSARWGDELAPAGEDAPGDDGREEPTLRELVAGALFAADFRVMRGAWPLDRGAFLNEVSVSPVWLDRGFEVVSVAWQGAAKGSAIARHAGAFHAARLALEAAGLTVEHAGGLRLEVGWAGDPVGSEERTAVVRREMAAERTAA